MDRVRASVVIAPVLLLAIGAVVSACGGAEPAPERTAPPPGELTSVRIEVHEAPG